MDGLVVKVKRKKHFLFNILDANAELDTLFKQRT